ncbi:MAG: FtsX-like permease family protein [Ruminococcaceae bacterium]|nr:FtsX-like permease family protein [Oscillospiraceae bacterium]
MSIKQSLILALKSLMGSKMRSFLTMLGIIIGVAAVIIIVSTINGMTKTILDEFDSMGATNIIVSVRGRGSSRSVDIDDMQSLVDDNPTLLKGMTPSITVAGAVVKSGSENLDTTSVTGANESYAEINNKKAEYGRDLQYMDCNARLTNCVVGTYVAKEFFGTSENALGNELKINGKTFTIVGVLEEKADSAQSSADDIVIIPYTVAQKLAYTFTIGSYTFCALSKEVADKAQTLIEKYLYDVFSNTNAYTVTNMSSLIETMDDMTAKMSLMGAAVAGISLLVGGIGIMNIMLVSVTERTREIGIRKSLGAAPWDIMSQFVVEAITTSSIGGILGIILGIIGSYAARFVEGLNPVVSISAIIISFTVSALIGVAFGYFPAKKAAALNPIDALRYD